MCNVIYYFRARAAAPTYAGSAKPNWNPTLKPESIVSQRPIMLDRRKYLWGNRERESERERKQRKKKLTEKNAYSKKCLCSNGNVCIARVKCDRYGICGQLISVWYLYLRFITLSLQFHYIHAHALALAHALTHSKNKEYTSNRFEIYIPHRWKLHTSMAVFTYNK